jgi:hypothetical protein
MSRIFIGQPCNEKWNKMIPLEEGRLCQVCSTPVIDFTQKSEREILDYFEKKSGEHICGKYAASTVSTPRSIRFKWLLITLTFIFGAGFISSCRKHRVTMGARFTIRTDIVKTEISKPSSHAAAQHRKTVQ